MKRTLQQVRVDPGDAGLSGGLFETWHGRNVSYGEATMDPSTDLVFPVLTDPPPAPVVDMEAFFHLVEEARDLVRDRAALDRNILAEDVPVRFRL